MGATGIGSYYEAELRIFPGSLINHRLKQRYMIVYKHILDYVSLIF